MSTSPLFDAARRAVSRGVIESLVPGGEWRADGDYWVCSPLRADKKIGSFHLTPEGLWKDFATDEGGDLIDLAAAMRGCSKVEAAEEICRLGGVSTPEQPRARSKGKPKPQAIIPIPEEGRQAILSLAKSEWARRVYGTPSKGWRYHTEDGLAFVVMRYDDCPNGERKQLTQFYWSSEGAKNGLPPQLRNSRPLYRLQGLRDTTLPILVVEGEKCADVEAEGWYSVTWCGGSSSVDKTDWAPLVGRRVVIWPDADRQADKNGKLKPDHEQPGIKAALAIQARIPGAVVLDVREYAAHKDGWDIADAEAEGVDLASFIAGRPPLHLDAEAKAKLPFSFLGHDAVRYWFLPRKRRMPFAIDMGHFSASQLLELAPLAWWGAASMVKDNGTIKTDAAQDWIIDEQERVGMVDLRHLRGAGVWRDGEEIVVNDGRQIVTLAGERLEYETYRSAAGAEYIPSETHFGDMTGPESDDAEGEALLALFCSQPFARRLDPVLLLGWALIAPFGGLLVWRPHMWLTGKKGTGKSQVILALLVDPLLGEFAHYGVGRKTTEAGLRRSINMTAKPVRLDEMEAKSKRDADHISSIVNLPILSAQDTSAVVTMAAGSDGTVTFIVRSCFLFASVNRPDDDAQVQSRFVQVEKLEVRDVREEMRRMSVECARVMRDPGRYRRRMFRAMPRVLDDIPRARALLLEFIHDPRECDLLAPLLCAAWAVRSTGSIDTEAGRAWLAQYLDDAMRTHADRVEDEDRVVEHIIAAPVRTDDLKSRTVAELLLEAGRGSQTATDLLSRHGLRFTSADDHEGSAHRALAIAIKAEPLREMLAGTPFAEGYDAQLMRSPLYLETKMVRSAIGNRRCRCLHWERFRERYLGGDGQMELTA